MKVEKPKEKQKQVEKDILTVRTFLNKKGEGTAFIAANVHRHHLINTTKKSCYIHSDAIVTISDCSRMITLSFDLYDKKNRLNSLYKLRKLKEVIDQFEKALVLEYTEIEKAKKENPKRR